ncbi:hypothetical protein FBY34_8778 [Streptomyces sp. SLBN-115]|nr:hypothetical protein FBY34_8778 [Streptomyces sp. SLBN-115]
MGDVTASNQQPKHRANTRTALEGRAMTGENVAAATLVCSVGVPAAGRASAGVADDVPFSERTDEIGVPWWQFGHGPRDPVGEEGEILIAWRQEAGGDEQPAHVGGGSPLGQRVEGFVVQCFGIERRASQEAGGRASAQPLQDAVGVGRAGQYRSEGLERPGHACTVRGEQVRHAGGQGAAGTGRPDARGAQGSLGGRERGRTRLGTGHGGPVAAAQCACSGGGGAGGDGRPGDACGTVGVGRPSGALGGPLFSDRARPARLRRGQAAPAVPCSREARRAG